MTPQYAEIEIAGHRGTCPLTPQVAAPVTTLSTPAPLQRDNTPPCPIVPHPTDHSHFHTSTSPPHPPALFNVITRPNVSSLYLPLSFPRLVASKFPVEEFFQVSIFLPATRPQAVDCIEMNGE